MNQDIKDIWNVFERCLKGLPRTTNGVESWHSTLKDTDKLNLKLVKLIELLRLQQSKTENLLAKIKAGNKFPRSQDQAKKDNNIFNLCIKYQKENVIKFLEGIAMNFSLFYII